MRNLSLEKTSAKDEWRLLNGKTVLATFPCKDYENLSALSALLCRCYPSDSAISLIIDLPPVEVEVPDRRNRSLNTSDPNNSWTERVVDDQDMESALYILVERYKEEFQQLCLDCYLDRKEEESVE